MEYVEGRPLSDLLTTGPLDAERARSLIEQAAVALAQAHAVGLIHRDIKPANLLVTPDGTVKITDFGIARAMDGLALTQTGQIVGTPSYLSPEQAEGQAATPESDVYALGVVLFECLTGRRPFEADSPVALALAHVREPVPDLPADVPGPLAAVVEQAMSKHPGDRYPDAAALAAALASARPQDTLVMTGPVPAPAPQPTPVIPVAADVARRFRIPRERWPHVGAAALVALFLVVLVVAALSPDGSGTKDTPRTGTSPSAPSVSTSATVSIRSAAYVGKPVGTVKQALAALQLTSRVHTIDNPGGHPAGTVAGIQPTGAVATGSTITLDVWGAAPKPQPKPPAHHKGKGKGKHR
jgi:serine/threonine-protein kinase